MKKDIDHGPAMIAALAMCTLLVIGIAIQTVAITAFAIMSEYFRLEAIPAAIIAWCVVYAIFYGVALDHAKWSEAAITQELHIRLIAANPEVKAKLLNDFATVKPDFHTGGPWVQPNHSKPAKSRPTGHGTQED